MEPKNLTAAKQYITFGWKIFPLRPQDKRPLSIHGFHDATSDPLVIERWWTQEPRAGVAVATGKVSGIVVVDVDPRNHGIDSLADLEAKNGPLPTTWESLTGGGGRHLFYSYADGVMPSAKPWPGIDIKADGGYVVLPFSIHPSGFYYRWREGHSPDKLALAPAPEWLVRVLEDRKTQLVVRALQSGEKIIPKGRRNDALTSLAGTMHRRGMEYAAILAALIAENIAKCKPALPEEEIREIVGSVTSRYMPDEEASPGEDVTPRIQWVDPMEVLEQQPPPIEWVLSDRLAKGDCALLVGAPGVGKSWLVADLALTAAAGVAAFGYFNFDNPLTVLLIDEENPVDEVHRRFYKLAKARKVTASVVAERLFLSKSCQGFSFRDETYVRSLEQHIERIQPDLVIFDSLVALSSISNENDPLEIRRFFHDKLYPLRGICNSTILFVHHPSKAVYQIPPQVEKGGLARGSIDLTAVCESVMLVSGLPDKTPTMRFEALKVRRGIKPPPLLIRLLDMPDGGVCPEIQSEDVTFSLNKEIKVKIVEFLGKVEKLSREELQMKILEKFPVAQDNNFRKALSDLCQAGSVIKNEGFLLKCNQNEENVV